MESNFLDEGCDEFMNENEIKTQGKTKGEGFEEVLSFKSKKDDTM
jgi:hypothetical protein